MTRKDEEFRKFINGMIKGCNADWKERTSMTLLHGTCSQNVPKIEKKGLKDPYLTNNSTIAKMFAEIQCDALEEPGDPVVLEVTVDDLSKMKADEESYYMPSPYAEEQLGVWSFEHYERLRKKGIIPPITDKDWLTTLCLVSSARYEGTIEPSKVKRY